VEKRALEPDFKGNMPTGQLGTKAPGNERHRKDRDGRTPNAQTSGRKHF
jgi:hypothetical protein